ncbi:MAG: glycosyltransferase family 39 protein [Thermoanaerobaculia bacterium]
MKTPWDRATVAWIIAFCALKALVHLSLVNRYGYHGDELYFLECGRHLAFGYVDHPPLIPWLARLADDLGGSLLALRLPAIAAGTGTMAFTALLVREWGGGRRAQLLALLCLLLAPAALRMAAMLDIPVVEVFLCTVAAYLVARARSRGERWTWVLAGGALGLAMLAKHSSLLWGGALAMGIVATQDRRALASRWPWIGAAVALLFFAPNLVWQADHGFATFEFMRTLRHEVLAEQGRGLFVAGQLLYFHPLAVPVWVSGLRFAFTRAGLAARPFALLFLAMFVFLLVTGGKPYYLASAYPAVLAAGAIALERRLATRATAWRALVASLAATGAGLALLTLPVLPIRTVDATIESVLGWAVPPMALTHDLHGMFGWEEHAATVERIYRSLPDEDRARASVLTGSYSQAAAVNRFRREAVPRAVSGNMTYYLWGPDGERGAVLIAYGLPREILDRHYRRCAETARIEAPLARPWDRDLPVYVCREPLGTMSDLWPDVRRFGHVFPPPRRTESGR